MKRGEKSRAEPSTLLTAIFGADPNFLGLLYFRDCFLLHSEYHYPIEHFVTCIQVENGCFCIDGKRSLKKGLPTVATMGEGRRIEQKLKEKV